MTHPLPTPATKDTHEILVFDIVDQCYECMWKGTQETTAAIVLKLRDTMQHKEFIVRPIVE